MTSGHPRVACCIEGCGRGTTRIEQADGWTWLDTGTTDPGWMCGRHWPRVPRALKAERTALLRAWRTALRRARVRSFWELPPGSPPRLEIVDLERQIREAWSRCVAVASGGPVGDTDEVPPALAEDLRRLGL